MGEGVTVRADISTAIALLSPTILLKVLRSCSKMRIRKVEKQPLIRASVRTGLLPKKLTLPTIVARAKTGLLAEELREMTGIRVAHLNGNSHNALLCFAEQSSC
jgi:hypothetical protein